jgi:hypothetical protein
LAPTRCSRQCSGASALRGEPDARRPRITLALPRALAQRKGPLTLVHFDTQVDTWPDKFWSVLRMVRHFITLSRNTSSSPANDPDWDSLAGSTPRFRLDRRTRRLTPKVRTAPRWKQDRDRRILGSCQTSALLMPAVAGSRLGRGELHVEHSD